MDVQMIIYIESDNINDGSCDIASNNGDYSLSFDG